MNDKKWSNYQIDIFNAIKNSNKNIIVNAVAGSGKTTTIVEACKRLKLFPNKVQFLAFNKSIANELAEKLKGYAQVNTLHSFGYAVLRQAFKGKRIIIDDKKYIRLLQNNICDWSKYINHEEMSNVEIYNSCCQIKKIFDLARVNLVKYGDIESLRGICDAYGICDEFDELEIVNSLLKDCYRMPDNRIIDFTDMVVLPLHYRTYISTFKFVFIDECQDLNAAQRELMLCAAKGGRFIAVGDRKQAINGFCGADCLSFDKIAETPNTIELPLSVNYRCGSDIIKLVQEIVPQIQACNTAESGKVESYRLLSKSLFHKGDMVLCRKSAPLVGLCFKLLQNGITAVVKGGDIAESMLKLINKANCNSIDELSKWIDDEKKKTATEIAEYLKISLDKAKKTKRYLNLSDRLDCIKNICVSQLTDVSELKDYINKMFDETNIKNAVVLSTAHKSKGLEADRVLILTPSDFPMITKYSKDWEIQQEYNLKYVAWTRAKKELVFIEMSESEIQTAEISDDDDDK